jgi:putative phosphoribosyl transferase
MVFSPETLSEPRILFENRLDAGNRLITGLSEFIDQRVVVFAIPNGGVPLAIQVASALKSDLDVIVCRKLSLPMNEEGGLGAIADDGTTFINEDVIRRDGIDGEQVEHEVAQVKANIRERSLLYKGSSPAAPMVGKTAIIVDDGLASGITMSVAVQAIRHRRPRQIVVAVPLASMSGFNRVKNQADRIVTCAIGRMKQFYLADFYKNWRDISDQEALHYLEQWRKRYPA